MMATGGSLELSTLPYEASRVAEVLSIFYTTQSAEYRQQAHVWLCRLQESPDVCNIAVQLLADANAPDAAKLFASNCLQLKLQQPIAEQESLDALEHLKSFLVEQIFSPGRLAPLVRSRLSFSLTSLMLQLLPDMWPNPIQDLLGQHAMLPHAELLCVLAALPESFRQFAFPVERRSSVRRYLRDQIPVLQGFLGLVAKELTQMRCDLKLTRALFACIEAWFDLESDIEDWAPLIFSCLSLDEELDCSDPDFPDLYASIAQLFTCIAGNTALVQYASLSRKVFEFMDATLQRRLNFNIASTDRLEDNTDAQEVHMALARMLATLFETHAGFFVKQWMHLPPDLRERLLRSALVLSVPIARYPTEEGFSALMVPVWTNLYEDLSCTPRLATEENGAIVAQIDAGLNEARTGVLPYFVSLVTQLIHRKLRLPDDQEQTDWSQETWEAFDLYRKDQSDVLMYAQRLIQDRYFECFWSLFEPKAATDWTGAEVAFFALECVGDNPPNAQALAAVFGNLPNFGSTLASHHLLANTVLRCICKYASAIVDNDWYVHVLPTLFECLGPGARTAHCATLALKDILTVKHDDYKFGASCQQVLPGGAYALLKKLYAIWQDTTLPTPDRSRAVTCLGLVINCLEPDQAFSIIGEMVHPRVSALEGLVNGSSSAFASKDAFVDELEFLATLLGHLGSSSDAEDHPSGTTQSDQQGQHPVVQVMEKLLPLLGRLYAISGQDSQVGLKISEILRLSLLNLMDRASGLVPAYVEVLCQLFPAQNDGGTAGAKGAQRPPPIPALAPAQNLMLIFAQYPAHTTCLLGLLATITGSIVPFCAPDYSDLVEEFIGLCRKLVKKQAVFVQFVPGEVMVQILQCAIKGLEFAEFGVLKSASQLLGDFFQLRDQLSAFVSQYGPELMMKVFGRLKLEPSVSSVEYLADVMFYLVKFYPEEIGRWRAALPQHPLVASMMQECVNKRKFKEFAKKINVMQRKGQISL